MNSLQQRLKVYAFDWDDNILHMKSRITMYLSNKFPLNSRSLPNGVVVADSSFTGSPPNEEFSIPIHVTTAAYPLLREEGFQKYVKTGSDSFQPFQSNSQFLFDLYMSLQGQPLPIGPSFDKIIQAIVTESPFCIITARGQHPRIVAFGLRMVLSHPEISPLLKPSFDFDGTEFTMGLTKEYFELLASQVLDDKEELGTCFPLPTDLTTFISNQKMYCVSNLDFIAEYQHATSLIHNVEDGKAYAIRQYIQFISATSTSQYQEISVGFSDDDANNVGRVTNIIQTVLLSEYPNLKFVVYDSSNPTNVTKNVIRHIV